MNFNDIKSSYGGHSSTITRAHGDRGRHVHRRRTVAVWCTNALWTHAVWWASCTCAAIRTIARGRRSERHAARITHTAAQELAAAAQRHGTHRLVADERPVKAPLSIDAIRLLYRALRTAPTWARCLPHRPQGDTERDEIDPSGAPTPRWFRHTRTRNQIPSNNKSNNSHPSRNRESREHSPLYANSASHE